MAMAGQLRWAATAQSIQIGTHGVHGLWRRRWRNGCCLAWLLVKLQNTHSRSVHVGVRRLGAQTRWHGGGGSGRKHSKQPQRLVVRIRRRRHGYRRWRCSILVAGLLTLAAAAEDRGDLLVIRRSLAGRGSWHRHRVQIYRGWWRSIGNSGECGRQVDQC